MNVLVQILLPLYERQRRDLLPQRDSGLAGKPRVVGRAVGLHVVLRLGERDGVHHDPGHPDLPGIE